MHSSPSRTRQVLAVMLIVFAILAGCGQLDGNALIFRTADPRLNFGVHLLPAPPLPTVAPAVVPLLPTVTPTPAVEVIPSEEVGETLPEPLPEPPCDYRATDGTCQPIKGNIGRTGKIYHVPGQANYDNVKIDEAAGELFFATEAEAIAAGFRKAQR